MDWVIQILDNGLNYITEGGVRATWAGDSAHRMTRPRPDTAQAYRNEAEAGIALRETGFARKGTFITKYSDTNGLDIDASIRKSLSNVSSWGECNYGWAFVTSTSVVSNSYATSRRPQYPHSLGQDGKDQGS